jgi:hypothetical protein
MVGLWMCWFALPKSERLLVLASLARDFNDTMRFTEVYSNYMYHLVIQYSHEKSQCLIGKPSINGPFSMAMSNNQRVIILVLKSLARKICK